MIDELVRGAVAGASELTQKDRDRMFFLLTSYFEGCNRQQFEADLKAKDGAVVLRTSNGEIQGFSTFKLISASVQEQHVRGVFSGDTIIDRVHQRQLELPKVWGRYMLELEGRDTTPMYWFLISSGYKTYRFLRTFFQEFYPRTGMEIPPFQHAVLRAFATQMFGEQYDQSTGIIRFTHSQERLKSDVAPVTPERLRDPDVRFFVDMNPEHSRGVELACLARISRENYSPFINRIIEHGTAKRDI